MSFLVTRLRLQATCVASVSSRGLMREAADEIERLAAELDNARQRIDTLVTFANCATELADRLREEIASLAAERDREITP